MKNIARLLMTTLFLLAALSGCEGGAPKGEPVSAKDGHVRIDTSGIGEGETAFFRYEPDGGGLAVFMVARTNSGVLKAAFDACITCYPHGMGYRAEDDCVVCAFCDTKFGLDELGTGRGNCIPVELAFVRDGDDVLIRESDLAAGTVYFRDYNN